MAIDLNFLTSKKAFYIMMAGMVVIVFIIILFILRNVGGRGSVGQVQLELWGVFDTRRSFSSAIRGFEQSHPGMSVRYTQFSYEDYEKALIEALAENRAPDIVMIHHTWLSKHREKLSPMPMNSRFTEEPFMTPDEFKSQFVDVAYNDLVRQNNIYALPLYVDTLALFYNKDMFNTAGITRPPADWEEFNDDVMLLTKFNKEGDIIQAGAALGTARNINRSTDILSALMIQNGTRMNNDSNTAVTMTRAVNGDKVGENALEYYTDFANPLKEVYTWDDGQFYSIDAFIEGKVAMMFNYSHQIDVIQKKIARLNFDIAPFPQFSELDAKNYANYWALSVTAASKNKDAAWEFVDFMGSKEGTNLYLASTLRPAARRDITDVQRNDPKLGIFAVQALSAKSWHQVDNDTIDTILADMIDDVNFKRLIIRRALQAAESKINTLVWRQP